MTAKHYVDEEFGEVETLEYCIYGLCPLCGEPNRDPKKFGEIWFCRSCFITRTDECVDIKKSFQKLSLPDEQDTKKYIPDETFK
jgi:ribosomal protein L37AE/L43A